MGKGENIQLPAIIDRTTPALTVLTQALGIPRDVLASDYGGPHCQDKKSVSLCHGGG